MKLSQVGLNLLFLAKFSFASDDVLNALETLAEHMKLSVDHLDDDLNYIEKSVTCDTQVNLGDCQGKCYGELVFQTPLDLISTTVEFNDLSQQERNEFELTNYGCRDDQVYAGSFVDDPNGCRDLTGIYNNFMRAMMISYVSPDAAYPSNFNIQSIGEYASF